MDCKLDLKSILFICFVVLALQHFFNIFGVEAFRNRRCNSPSKPCGRPPRCTAKKNFNIYHGGERINGRACTRQQLLREHTRTKKARRMTRYRRPRR